MALLATQSITSAGLTPTTVAATGGGDTIAVTPGDDRTFLYVNNGGGSPINVTVADPGTTPAGNSGSAPAISVTNATAKYIAIPIGAINAATGLASVTYSGVTSVTVAALRR